MDEVKNEDKTIRNAIETLKKSACQAVEKIKAEAEELVEFSNHQRMKDVVFRTITAILAVASPALVAYSSAEAIDSSLRLLAILLAGIAGATTTLQSVFGFKESFLRNASAALSLEQVAENLSLASKNSESQKKEIDEYAELKGAIQKALDKSSEVKLKLKKSLIEDYEQ